MATSHETIAYKTNRNIEANFKLRISTLDNKELIFKTLKHREFKVQKFKSVLVPAKSQSSHVEHFKVLILFENLLESSSQQDHQYYVKILDGDYFYRGKRPVGRDWYNKEDFFYNCLLEEFKNLNLDVSFVPVFYYSTPYVFYFEDISLRGFENIPKGECFDLGHCKLALNTLAKFHCNSIIFGKELKENKKRKLPKEYSQMYKKMLPTKKLKETRLKYSFKLMTDIAIMFPVEEFKKGTEFMRHLTTFTAFWKAEFGRLNRKYHSTFLHDDLSSNNFLFKYEGTAPVESVLIDYQQIKYGPPALDVLNIIYVNTRKIFRDEYLSWLINYYYVCLCECLLTHKVDNPITKNELLKLCDVFQIFSKIQSICDRCVMFIPEFYVQLNEICDDDSNHYIFIRKMNAFRRCYENDYLFKTMISEDMEELRDMLLNFPLSKLKD